MMPARGFLASWSTVLGGSALGASGLGIIAELVQFWGKNVDYADRFLILLAAGWLIWRSRAILLASTRGGIGYVMLLAGSAIPWPAWYLAAQVGPRSILLWWLAGAWLLAAGGTIVVTAGWRGLRALAFPLAFVLLALPIPERIELPLQEKLKQITTTLADHGLRASGFDVERRGFELKLSRGVLEVVDACSGVRSITALLAIAVFVSHLRGFGLARGLLMLALALPVIAAVNALRIIFTGWIQESFGPQMIQGTPHEILGGVMVLVGLGLVLLLSQLLRPRRASAETVTVVASPVPALTMALPPISRLAAGILVLGLAGSIYAYRTGTVRTVSYSQAAPLENLPLTIGEWSGKELPIPDEIKYQLAYDRAIFRLYEDKIGRRIHVWVIYWEAGTAIRGYHHPDLCFPNRGWKRTREDRQLLDISEGLTLPIGIRHFERERDLQRLFYWTQEGQRMWTDEDEVNAQKGHGRYNWIADRLVANPPELSARLSVLIQAEVWGRGERGERLLNDFTRCFAQELYHICSWARPPVDAGATK